MGDRGADWVPLAERDRLSVGRLICMSFNQFTANMIWTPTGTLLSPLMNKLKFSTTVSAFVYLMGPISGFIISPIIGLLSDNTTMKFGRRRVYLIIGEVGAFVGMMILAFVDKLTSDNTVLAIFCFIGYFVACCGGNTLSMPGRAMVTDLTPAKQQVQAANICTLQQGFAGIITSVFGAVQLNKAFGEGGSFGYEQFILLLCCILGCIALIISVIASPEEQLTHKSMEGNFFVAIWKVFKMFNTNMILMLFAHFGFALGNNQWNTQWSNFFVKIIYQEMDPKSQRADDATAFSQLLLCFQTVFQIFFCFFSHHLTNRVGLKGTWLIGCIAGMIGTGSVNIRVRGNGRWFYLLSCFFYAYFCTTGGGVIITIISLYIAEENMGCAQGILNIFNCLGQFCCIIFLQWLLADSQADKWAAGDFTFGPNNIIGLAPIWICFALIVGYIGISRTEAEHQDNLDNDDEKEEVDDDALRA